jgi:hypothetical protein
LNTWAEGLDGETAGAILGAGTFDALRAGGTAAGSQEARARKTASGSFCLCWRGCTAGRSAARDGGKTMRTFGNLLLVAGIIFEGLFVLAALGGAQFPPIAFVMPGILLTAGATLRIYGTGLAQQSAPSAGAAQSPTAELPLTPAVSVLIAREVARSRRFMAVVILVGISFFLLLGAGLDLALSAPGGLRVFPFFVAISVAFGLIVGGIWFLTGERPARRDLRASSYLRTSGPVQLVSVLGGYLLRLADRSFLLNGRAVISALRDLPWATVDYSRHAHRIFGVRDRSGQSIYRCVGYQSEPPKR